MRVQFDAKVARLRFEDVIKHNRGHADADCRADLRHRLEQRASNALLMRVRHLGYEKRTSRERKVRAKCDETRRGEAERPERCFRVDHGEQEVRAAGHERASSDDVHDVDATNRERDEEDRRYAHDEQRHHARHGLDRA